MPAPDRFVALVIYRSTPAEHLGQADALYRLSEGAMRAMPGFIGARVFVGEDGGSVVSLVEWRDRESFINFRQSELGRTAVEQAGELHPTAYWLRPHEGAGAD